MKGGPYGYRVPLLVVLLSLSFQSLQGLAAASEKIPSKHRLILAGPIFTPSRGGSFRPLLPWRNQSLLARISSAAMNKLPEKSQSNPNDDENAPPKERAVSKIRFCAWASFASISMDVIGEILKVFVPEHDSAATADADVHQMRFRSVVDSLESVDLVYRLCFGLALSAVAKIYAHTETLGDQSSPSQKDSLYTLGITMSYVWGGGTILLLFAAFVDSMILQDKLLEAGSSFLARLVSPQVITSLGVIILSSVYQFFLRTKERAIQRFPMDDKHMGRGGSEGRSLASVRPMGFAAARNMALCMGSVGVIGLMDLVIPLLTPSVDALERFFGLFEVYEDYIYVILLWRLNRTFVQTIAHATSTNTTTSEKALMMESNNALFEAQEQFYKKLAETILFTSGMQLLLPIYNAAASMFGITV